MTDTPLTASQLVSNKAYYTGRGDAGYWFDGGCLKSERPVNPYITTALRTSWLRGFRDVMAEERLSADTEWDQDRPWWEYEARG